MSVEQFPRDQYWKVIGTAELWNGGGFSYAGIERIAYVKLTMLKAGTAVGDEQFRIKLFNDAAMTSLYATGDWRSLAEVAEIVGADLTESWRADVRFDFPSLPWVEAGRQYFMAIESQNYTRDSSYFYVGFLLDWPYPTNTPNADPIADNLQRGLKAEFYNVRKLGFA
jgi:hypothetical protein